LLATIVAAGNDFVSQIANQTIRAIAKDPKEVDFTVIFADFSHFYRQTLCRWMTVSFTFF
jgi:hypothetical protein